MKSKLPLCLALILVGGLIGYGQDAQKKAVQMTGVRHPFVNAAEIDKNLTKQISNILIECQKIKIGTTRAELLHVFGEEGGISVAEKQTFVHRRCPYIKVDVEFKLSNPEQKRTGETRPTDTISKISKPYLGWMIID